MVDSVLAVALRKAGETPESLRPEHLDAILQQLSHGIRPFCRSDRVAQMMLELASLAE